MLRKVGLEAKQSAVAIRQRIQRHGKTKHLGGGGKVDFDKGVRLSTSQDLKPAQYSRTVNEYFTGGLLNFLRWLFPVVVFSGRKQNLMPAFVE